MTTDSIQPDPRTVEPAPDGPPARRASELIVHGLLEWRRTSNADARERRVSRALSAMDAQRPPLSLAGLALSGPARWVLGLAAALALAVFLTRLGVRTESTALATVQHSVAALREPGDRRFIVTVEGWIPVASGPEPGAQIDMRAPSMLVIHHNPPGVSGDIIVGRDAIGEWAITTSGEIDRENPRRRWPPWSLDGRTRIVDSLDRVLEELPRRFALSKTDRAALPDQDGPEQDHLTAERLDRAGPYPHYVELWIDPDSHQPTRMEFRWDDPGTRQAPPTPPEARDAPPDGSRRDEDLRARGGRNSAPPLPKRILFRRVNSPVFPPAWFDPKSHQPSGG